MLLRQSQMLLRQFMVLHCKQSAHKWTRAVQTPAVRGSAVCGGVASTAEEVRVLGGGHLISSEGSGRAAAGG